MTNWNKTAYENAQKIQGLLATCGCASKIEPHEEYDEAYEVSLAGEGESSRHVIVTGTDTEGCDPSIALYDGMGGAYEAHGPGIRVETALAWLLGSTEGAWSGPRAA